MTWRQEEPSRALQELTASRRPFTAPHLQSSYHMRSAKGRCSDAENRVIRSPQFFTWVCNLSAVIVPSSMGPTSFVCYNPHVWRGDRVAYGAALEKRCAAMHRGFKSHPLRGEVLEWPIRRAWRARVAQATVGSNPTLSATPCVHAGDYPKALTIPSARIGPAIGSYPRGSTVRFRYDAGGFRRCATIGARLCR